MSTGSFDSWKGTITDIGPLYPFVGSEVVLVLIGLAFWIVWHIVQWKMESSNYNDDMEVLKNPDKLDRAMKGEKVLRDM